ncbi:S8 family serine peptidase [Acidipropionibacterium jensenii]|uniref:S8 family serine peptidase n=1 Tax=Acidipropionibacterium jensenii TaxID=1749 RepID=UPI00214CC76E|nr:S8 family serine peptidase [Acidipropionibacterium jensenii]
MAIPPVASAAPADSRIATFKAIHDGPVVVKTPLKGIRPDATVNVILQMTGDPVAVVQADKGRELTSAETAQVRSTLRTRQNAITGSITSRGGHIVSQMQSAYNGIHLTIKKKNVDELAALPNVTAVHVLTPKKLNDTSSTPSNTVSVPYLGVPQVWQNTGYTGKGIKVAILDTGIDYTHADFGGSGKASDFTTAREHSTQTPNPKWFGPSAPRVKGGTDLVGDAYDASSTNPAALTPAPDSNPIDCGGHGSHVAGTAVGSGVTAAGKTYTGPYNSATAQKSFTVGPGVAPQADIYSVKVFGCTGSTDVITDAIDWSVAHHMNVINMSLGGDYGTPDDPDSVAASNAVASGVVVVAASGNAGPNPYLSGSPANGHGVLSVGAVDAIKGFPAATLKAGSASVKAINLNGAPLLSGSHPVVALADDPATPDEDESLGCSPQAYTKAFTAAGIRVGADGTPTGASPVALVRRGTCYLVSKAINAQKAGAGAAVLIYSTDDYPPYLGAITSDPDNSDSPYTVTIPYLGVRASDGAGLVAAAGRTATMTAADPMANPSYTKYADFSSAGPASGSSSLAPNVSAPGVSIASAGMGTGTGSAIMSGTSMATPHVAGVAALTVQAHRDWTASQIASAIGSTADPDKVGDYQPVAGGGLVDAAQAVSTSTFAIGDRYRDSAGPVSTASLSFGFQESSKAFTGRRTITLVNKGRLPVTYTLSNQASSGSRPATLTFSSRRVVVRPHSSATVAVLLTAPASKVGASLSDTDPYGFREISGNVVARATGSTLRVPYLLVPRAQANLTATSSSFVEMRSNAPVTSLTASRTVAKVANPGKGSGRIPSASTVTLTNRGGALPADASVFSWGLYDGRRDSSLNGATSGGYDLRAAGVQSLRGDGDQLLVFAVNNYDRFSNPASNEYDVEVDTNGDGKADYLVAAADYGLVTTGYSDGQSVVFVVNLATGGVSAKYGAVAPTDSSTIELPVDASDLGLTASKSAFSYTVGSNGPMGTDSFGSNWASYDAYHPAIADGGSTTVAVNRTATLKIATDPELLARQKPWGVMVVSYENHSGASEAVLLQNR